MTWNHRVIRHTHHSPYLTGTTVSYLVHEVYYDDDHQIRSWTTEAVTPCGETLAELADELMRFKAACRKPVLEIVDLELREVER